MLNGCGKRFQICGDLSMMLRVAFITDTFLKYWAKCAKIEVYAILRKPRCSMFLLLYSNILGLITLS